jgi:hypothetical protein
MTVGAFDMVCAGIEVVGGTFVEEVGDGLELVVEVEELEPVMVEKLITMTVVESPPYPDWKPADAARLDEDGPGVGNMTEPVLLSEKKGTETDVGFDKGEAELLVVARIWLVVDGPALGCVPPAAELEILRVRKLEEDDSGELPLCEAPMPGPPETAGCSPPWLVDVDVVPVFEATFVDVVVECVGINPEGLVLGEVCIVDAGSAAPGASELPADAVELVDVCVDENEVVLVVLSLEVVETVDTWLELDEEDVEVVMVDDVVSGTGIIVRISASEDELVLSLVWVVFEKGALRGRLHLCQRSSPMEQWVGLTICHFHHVAPDLQSSEWQVKRSWRLFVIRS